VKLSVPPPVSPKNFNKSEFFVSDPIPETVPEIDTRVAEGVPVNVPVSKRPLTSCASHGPGSTFVRAQPLILIVPPLEKFQVVIPVAPVKFPV
jgi:hypothetical protein